MSTEQQSAREAAEDALRRIQALPPGQLLPESPVESVYVKKGGGPDGPARPPKKRRGR